MMSCLEHFYPLHFGELESVGNLMNAVATLLTWYRVLYKKMFPLPSSCVYSQSMPTRITTRLRRLPASTGQPALLKFINLHRQWVHGRFLTAPTRHTDIALRTGRRRHQQVRFGEKLQVIAHLHGTRFGKVLVRVARKSSAHEHVEHIVYVRFRQSGQHGGAGQIGVATNVAGTAVGH